MANNKEEAGKGTPRPGDSPGSRRTYATIDLTASEIAGRDKPPATAAAAASASAAAETKSGGKPEARSEAKSPGTQPKSADPAGPGARSGDRIAGGLASLGALTSLAPWLSH